MDGYKYLKIEEAIPCVNQKLNLIGVILEFSVPQKTKGTGRHYHFFTLFGLFRYISRFEA